MLLQNELKQKCLQWQIYVSDLILSFTFSVDLDTFCQKSTSHSKIWWDHCGGLGNHLSWLQLQARVLQRLPRLQIRCALSHKDFLVLQDDTDAGLVDRSLPATAKTQQGLHKIFTGAWEITCLGSSSKTMISFLVLQWRFQQQSGSKGSVCHSKD